MRAERAFVFAHVFSLALIGGGAALGFAATLFPALGYFQALGSSRFTLDIFAQLAAMPGLWRGVGLSLWTGFAATALSVFFCFSVLAFAWDTRGFRLISHAISPLLSVPHAAAAIGLALVIAPSGLLFRLLGFDRPPNVFIPHDPYALSLIGGLVLKEVPFLFLVSLAALAQVPAEGQMRVARSLGYSRVTGFAKVLIPQVYSRIRLPVLAVLSYSAAPPEMAMILGPQEPPLLIVSVMRWMNSPELDLKFVASAGAVLQLGVIAGLAGLWLGLEQIRPLTRAAADGARASLDGLASASSLIFLSISGAVLVLAGVSLGLWSVAEGWLFPALLPSGFTLEHWREALGQAGPLLLAGAAIAAVSSGICVALAALKLEAGASGDGLAFVPLVLPQISILLGIQWLLIPFGAGFAWAAVLIAHVIFVYPYVWLSLAGPWRGFDARYVLTARSLGAGPWKVFLKVRVSMLQAAVLTSFSVGFAVSAGLYLPTLIAGAGRVSTITTEAVALASGGDRRVLAIHAMLQAALPFLGFWLAVWRR